jgi:hypothetical protein
MYIETPSADPPSSMIDVRQRPVSWLAVVVPIRLPERLGGFQWLFCMNRKSDYRFSEKIMRKKWIADDRSQLRGQPRHWAKNRNKGPHRIPVSPLSRKAPLTKPHNHIAAMSAMRFAGLDLCGSQV